ncbi:MAG: hypothetical protein E7597_06940 [Ruminococcaceae bacterium]|nr:hypothetical protein [Oscillospiraceae bacterium]
MEKKKGVKAANDLIYTVLATVIMQVVLQLIIYPLTTHFCGKGVTGNILYFIGIIYIVPQALGTSLHNVRLMMRKEQEVTNYDFAPHIAVFAAVSAVVCGLIGFADNKDPVFSIAYALFSVVYLLRIYSAVEFRLTLKFKGYFLYFCAISAGYLIGFGLFLLTDIWLFIFAVGEVLAVAYIFIYGRLFKNDGKTGSTGRITKTVTMVLLSTIVRDCVNQFDRVIIKQSISEDVVTQYNAVSLISKTIQMLVQPVSSLILTYLTVKDASITRKQLLKFTCVALGCGAVFYCASIVGTPIFVRLFYPSFYNEVMQYNLIVNLGLIVGFLSTMFMSILLSQGKTAIQMTIQSVWGAGYIVAAYYFVGQYQIWGLAYVTLVANMLKLAASVSFIFYDKKVKTQGVIN